MIHLWLDELSDLIANTTTPDVPARLGEADAAAVLAYRIAHDHYDHEEDAILHMPYFVVSELQATWGRITFQDLERVGMLELTYFEAADRHLDLDSLNARYQASKRTFVQFIEEVVESIAQRQGRSPSLLPIDSIELIAPAFRTPIDKRDPDRPEADYWQVTYGIKLGGADA